jgi:DNA-binding IclR family transcriptional regulator
MPPPSAYQTDCDPVQLEYEAATMTALDDRQFATTVAKGFSILRCFTPVNPVLGNSELAQRTGLGRPTVSRFTYTLTKLGYLRTDNRTGKYRLTPAVVALGYPVLATMSLRQLARPLMNSLAERTHASVSMGVRDRLSIVYVETSRSTANAAAQMSDVGLRYPIASTAIGHAYVAGCDAAERAAVLNEMKVLTPKAWAQYAHRLREAQQEFARKGFCSSYGEQHSDYCAVGVSFGRTVDGESIVFNCVAPLAAVSRRQLESSVGRQLVSMVDQLRSMARTL